MAAILAGYQDEADRGGLTIEYPLDETLFPPEIVPPTFRWQDADPGSDTWLVTIKFAGGGERDSFLTHDVEWTPSQTQWETLKTRSLEKQARVSVLGVSGDVPERSSRRPASQSAHPGTRWGHPCFTGK